MTEDDDLAVLLAQWWSRRRSRRAHRDSPGEPVLFSPRWLPTPGSALFTLVVVAVLFVAQSVGAIPLLSPASSAGTSAGTIAYQGRLADPDGAPLTGTYSMIFRLFAEATGGTPLWEETWTGPNSVAVSDGLFNVMLGSMVAIPTGVVTGHDRLWLGITVGTDDEMAPRVQLGSVPWAVQALTVPDGSVTTVKLADGAVSPRKLAFKDVIFTQSWDHSFFGGAVTSADYAYVDGTRHAFFNEEPPGMKLYCRLLAEMKAQSGYTIFMQYPHDGPVSLSTGSTTTTYLDSGWVDMSLKFNGGIEAASVYAKVTGGTGAIARSTVECAYGP